MLGSSHFFFCENRTIPLLSQCYENLIDSLIKNFLVGENWLGYQIFKIFKLTRFLERVVLTYTIITTGFRNLIIKFSIN
jgi:hypothetical protein